jgi:hypothetical protein
VGRDTPSKRTDFAAARDVSDVNLKKTMNRSLKLGAVLALAKNAALVFPRPAVAQFSTPVQALIKPFLHLLFTDNRILQRNIRVQLWCWATPIMRQ